jgi:hypothetical protein
MIERTPDVRNLLVLLYVVGVLLMADQAVDLGVTLMASPVAFESAQWRFGLFGLLISRGSVLLVADVMVFAAALSLEHRTVIRLLGALHLALGVALLAGLGLFVLDTLELRRMVRTEASQLYNLTAVRAGLIGLLGAALLLWSGVRALAVTRRSGRGRPRDGAPVLRETRE